MEPFTLEWWMCMLGKSNHKAVTYSWEVLSRKVEDDNHTYHRYYTLSEWIQRRIIKKYGEK